MIKPNICRPRAYRSMRWLCPYRVSPLSLGDAFHACSRFAHSTIPEEKWVLLVVYKNIITYNNCCVHRPRPLMVKRYLLEQEMKLLDFGMYSTKLALTRYYFLLLICCFVVKGPYVTVSA